MRNFYIKKGNLCLHIRQAMAEGYQDYSDINGMLTQEYFTSDKKTGQLSFWKKERPLTFWRPEVEN